MDEWQQILDENIHLIPEEQTVIYEESDDDDSESSQINKASKTKIIIEEFFNDWTNKT